ncbi:hypothetical protein [Nocardia rhamnosiphila]
MAPKESLRGYVPLEPTEIHPEWESKQGGGAPMTQREIEHLAGGSADENQRAG